MVPIESLENIQQAIFTFEIRFKKDEKDIVDKPFYIIQLRQKQLEKMDEDREREYKKLESDAKSKTSSSSNKFKR
jgi:hypothetical protein